MIKIPSPHACTPTATHFGSSTHFSIPCVFAPSHFPVVPCTIHTSHTSRRPASRDQCEARDTHVCRAPSYVVVRAPVRLPPRPARGADRLTPASPVAGTEQRTPPTTRQVLLTYSRAKCLSSRLTVMSRRRRHGVQSSTQGRGAARRLRVGLKAGPGAAARLEAGNCGEVFACLFQVCVVLSH